MPGCQGASAENREKAVYDGGAAGKRNKLGRVPENANWIMYFFREICAIMPSSG
jgi:hypothetical protein